MFWCLVSYYLRVHRHSKDIVVPLFMSYDIRQHRSGLVLFWRSLTIPPMVSFLKMPKMHCPTPSQYSFLIACYSLTTTWWQNFGTKLVDTLFFDLAVINTYCLILAVLSTQSLVLLCLKIRNLSLYLSATHLYLLKNGNDFKLVFAVCWLQESKWFPPQIPGIK